MNLSSADTYDSLDYDWVMLPCSVWGERLRQLLCVSLAIVQPAATSRAGAVHMKRHGMFNEVLTA